ncbi:hypothetical protein QOZ98_003154 [Planomicrobium stackebrandtii]|uniref:DUF1461 domain-containing protein n=1 Tax=Planomicrobium stackebrandtii TaxID=253160 RepID=A0ABU0GY85_9BACL|nr:hypothetical protein [Planomicrobium stackebrandtii]MDQ0430316.1 hypothetical protein [Planomicrobium stackebrandtii]
MTLTHRREKTILLIKVLSYFSLFLLLYYMIYNLKIFPGVLDYSETETRFALQIGYFNQENYRFSKELWDTGDQLRFALLKNEIDFIHNILQVIVFAVPVWLFLFLERHHISFFSISPRLKTLVFAALPLAALLCLIYLYIIKVDEVTQQIYRIV